jgi:DNA-binding beta-propeller fold protein YncE
MGAVWQFRVDASGAVTENNPRSTPADQAPQEVAFTPDGRFAYVANSGDFYGDGSISQYRINLDGTLMALTPTTVMTGTSPRHLAVNSTGSFLYALSSSGHATDDQHPDSSLSEYRITPNGQLVSVEPNPISTGGGPSEIVIVHRQGYAVSASNGYADVPLRKGSLSSLR